MDQMINAGAPVKAMPFGELRCGFFRMRSAYLNGKIFFAYPHGRWSFVFPVGENGLISREGAPQNIYPPEIVDVVVDPKSLGISEIKWQDN